MVRIGKKTKEARKSRELGKLYSIEDALTNIKKIAFAKFDESLEVAINTGLDTRQSDQALRSSVSMPNGLGKVVKVACVCKDDKHEIAKAAGADVVGFEDLIDDISNGKLNFDICIATPDVMGMLGRVARVLGPRGLMPNPKLGTVTTNIEEAVKKAKAGQVEYRADKAGVVHAGVGKISFNEDDLKENIFALYNDILKRKPASLKGAYVKSIYLSSTMGPSFAIDLASMSV